MIQAFEVIRHTLTGSEQVYAEEYMQFRTSDSSGSRPMDVAVVVTNLRLLRVWHGREYADEIAIGQVSDVQLQEGRMAISRWLLPSRSPINDMHQLHVWTGGRVWNTIHSTSLEPLSRLQMAIQQAQRDAVRSPAAAVQVIAPAAPPYVVEQRNDTAIPPLAAKTAPATRFGRKLTRRLAKNGFIADRPGSLCKALESPSGAAYSEDSECLIVHSASGHYLLYMNWDYDKFLEAAIYNCDFTRIPDDMDHVAWAASAVVGVPDRYPPSDEFDTLQELVDECFPE